MTTIEKLLHRRTDLSTFLVHLTRNSGGGSKGTARAKLLNIIETGTIEARNAFGPARDYEAELAEIATQKAVCFTETPLEHTWMMLERIENRALLFQPYGLAITKTTARRSGFNPVWYSDITKGQDWPIKAVNTMIRGAIKHYTRGKKLDVKELSADPVFPLFQLTPFFEQMGNPSGVRKEFWWEREWRHIGSYEIRPSKIVAVLAPADDHEKLGADLEEIDERWSARPLLDPRWGLERMIAALAGVDEDDVGPFPS